MNLLQRISQSNDEELTAIINEEIKIANEASNKIGNLGFLNNGISNCIFKGFIPLDTRIKYSSHGVEDYSMQTTDFIYEFAEFIKKYNILNNASIVYNLEYFINRYFGVSNKISREAIFNDIAWQTTETDEEYFKALDNNKIGDLKGSGAAMCTERAAVAQQLLSICGFESYYCIGCVDLGDRQEPHCFNIVKRKNDYALLDYSVPVPSYKQNEKGVRYYPFVGTMSEEEFIDFASTGNIKSFEDYHMYEKEKVSNGKQRQYVVGQYEIEKDATSEIGHKK